MKWSSPDFLFDKFQEVRENDSRYLASHMLAWRNGQGLSEDSREEF